MRIRLGYVAIAKLIGEKVTSSSNITYSNYKKIVTDEKKLVKLKSVTLSNLNGLEKILRYNIKHNIHFYRITSALIPLVTHPDVGYWGHREIFKKDFEYIGRIIRESNMRVDTHPDEFNVINSTDCKIVENSTKNLMRQVEWFKDLGYQDGKMVIHIGGATGGKSEGVKRFIKNFNNLPREIQTKLIIENDDKSYTAHETLSLCNEIGVPMVLDVHHHNCNNNGESLEDLLEGIFKTWENEKLPPKIHFSSPRDGVNDRKHADFINSEDFIKFIDIAKRIDKNFDIMLECKEKDIALFKLVSDIKNSNNNYIWIDETTFEV